MKVVAEIFNCVHCNGFVVFTPDAEGIGPAGDRCPCGAELYPVSSRLREGRAVYLNAALPERESRTVPLDNPRCAAFAQRCQQQVSHD